MVREGHMAHEKNHSTISTGSLPARVKYQ